MVAHFELLAALFERLMCLIELLPASVEPPILLRRGPVELGHPGGQGRVARCQVGGQAAQIRLGRVFHFLT